MRKVLCLMLIAIMLLSVGCSAAVSVVGANINDDGNLILSMNDGNTIDAGYAKGDKGDQGEKGIDGKDGRDGIDGVDGAGIKKAAVNDSGHLMIRLTDDTLIDTGYVIGADGKDGRDGVDGRDGRDGADGRDGFDGTNGKDGVDGKTPYIGDNGNWWIGEEDTGITARGNDGITPHIGDNGNWFIGTEDTGIYAGKEFPDGTFFTVTYDAGEGTLPDGTVTSVTVEALDTLDSMPSPTAPANKYFVGWYNDDVLVNVFTPIDGNMDLIAKYAANGSSVDGLIIVDNELVGYTGTDTEIVIPDGVTVIHDSAFKENTKLKKITLPNSIKSIRTHAFYGCSNLQNINIPEGITRIEEYTFYNCSKLSSFTFPSTLQYIGRYAFYGCSALNSIILNEGLTTLKEYAFANCTGLTYLNLPSTLQNIPNRGFSECSNLSTIDWAEGLIGIGTSAFFGCKNLKSLRFPDSLQFIQGNAFRECTRITSLIFGSDLVSVGNSAFALYTSFWNPNYRRYQYTIGSLKKVAFINNHSLKTIGSYAFQLSSYSLSTITLPDSVESIGDGAFHLANTTSDKVLAIYCGATTPPKLLGKITHYYSGYNYATTVHLYVPIESTSLYTAAENWNLAKIEGVDFINGEPVGGGNSGGSTQPTYNATVTTSSSSTPLNLRVSPSTSAEVYAQVSYGTRLTVVALENGWYKLNYNGITLWAMQEFVTLDSGVNFE